MKDKITYMSKVKFIDGFYKGHTGVAIKETFDCFIIRLDDGNEVRELIRRVKLDDQGEEQVDLK